ncbi:hypothetical protein MRB53_033658 [Persea americana]|uniref:Uncharacterized protein n=1 Tax=Persea americana TaxID=3435 RepID=A0ACC2KVI8_PERAE|nr:hypothetical protein MRB53_033658 [Persea americana]
MKDKEWQKINPQACSTIRLCLAKDQKCSVMGKTSAKELWQKLEEKYMTKSLENRIYLKKKLFRFEYRQGIFMTEHLDDFNKIIADLMNIDVKIDDDDKALLLLNSIPDSYDHFTHTLINRKTEVKYDVVSATLMNNEYRKTDKHAHRDSSSDALTVRGRSDDRTSGSKSRFK